MHTFTIATALVSFLSLSAAAPTLEKREDKPVLAGEVTICTGANGSGDCSTKEYSFNECNILPAPYYKNVLTFAPGHQILCRVTKYELPKLLVPIFHVLTVFIISTQDSCTTHGDLFIEYPGSAHFDKYNGKDYSKMTSFLCQKCTGCP
ncbi:uncharacterized protein IWZ02DRAFT_245298 [Phyllosticta citriasiana]|uniref:Uncharacterized protein n=1 Tax=Phyllosticta citriasiana TaxID=595635 RepID=A0ABR1KTE3_9PEZI